MMALEDDLPFGGHPPPRANKSCQVTDTRSRSLLDTTSFHFWDGFVYGVKLSSDQNMLADILEQKLVGS